MHKIQSGKGSLHIEMDQVPKILKPLVDDRLEVLVLLGRDGISSHGAQATGVEQLTVLPNAVAKLGLGGLT